MVLGDVEETITEITVDSETGEEVAKVIFFSLSLLICYHDSYTKQERN